MPHSLYIVILPPNGIVENTVVDLKTMPEGWNTQCWVFGSKDEYDTWYKSYDDDDKSRMTTHVVESVSFGSTGSVWLMNARDQL
jgi:hypothetical protein